MARRRLPERYRIAVTAAGLAPVLVLWLAYMAEVFLDDRLGSGWTKGLIGWLIAGDLAVMGLLALLFGFPLFAAQKSTVASISRVFWSVQGAALAFVIVGLVEALIYPAFALHEWSPERFVWHSFQMFLFGGLLSCSGIVSRGKLLRNLRDGPDN